MYKKRISFIKHHKRFSEKCLLYVLVLLVLHSTQQLLPLCQAGCRDQERDDCETVCMQSTINKEYNCTLRAVVILPKSTAFETSLPKVSRICI